MMRELRYWWWTRKKEYIAFWCARHTPRWLRYYIVINEACRVSLKNPRQVVPDITWGQIADNIENK